MSVSGSGGGTGGGTGGGLGRGRGGALMQSILDRKRQEEENQRRLERELALEEELKKKQQIESEQQQQKQQQQDNPPASTTGVGGIPRRPAIGRGGLLASLMASKAASATPTTGSVSNLPLTTATITDTQKMQEITQALQDIKKLSPTKPVQQAAVAITTRAQSSEPSQTNRSSSTSNQAASARGRGLFLANLTKKRLSSSGSGVVETTVVTDNKPPHISRRDEAELKKLELSSVLEVSSVVSSEHGSSSAAAAAAAKAKASGSGDPSTGPSGSGTGNTGTSYEKAAEELKIEEITRKQPVKRMGESGMSTNFSTNYVKLSCKNKGLYQYVVHYEPPIDSQYHRIKLLYQLSEITGFVRLFDGYVLFLPILLPDKTTALKVKRKNDGSEILVKIQLTKILPPEHVPGTVFNIIFKNIMKELKMSRIGQHYFSSSLQIDIPNHNLQIWPGYTTAVHEYEEGLYLVIDVAHKILRSQTCHKLMSDLYSKNANDMSRFREAVFNKLIGSVVLTRYNNKTYRVDDILWEENPTTSFTYSNGQSTTYYDYYKQHYNIDIKDLQQPLLLNRAKPRKQEQGPGGAAAVKPEEKGKTDIICLIPELCFVTGLSEDLKDDFQLKKELATHTRLTPKQRCEQLRLLIKNIRETPDALKQITNWGLELGETLENIPGRTLGREKIMFGKREIETDIKCDWTKAACNEEVLKGVEIKHWLIVYPGNKEQYVEKFALLSIEVGKRMGIKLAMPITLPLANDKADTYYNEIKKSLTENIQMVCIVFPMLSDARYMRVKKLCCIEYPVPSQVVVLKTINKPDNVLRTVAQKIVLQMNCKLGGELWRLSIPIKKMMVVGIDVYHKTEKKYKSLAGFVSSLNNDQTRWYSKVCFQMMGQELTDTLKIAFQQALKKYQEVNNYLPDKIFIYRDGVSDGQLSVVADHEVVQLKSVFEMFPDYKPQMSVIVVQKRISTRIFAHVNNREQTNPIPGAIIDHSITSKDLFDFYLVSQHVNQGTVTPTHYIVVYDDSNFKPDQLQRLSYKMTHLYFNWSGTIRVPAPCQYAHKLAFLTGQYLQDESSTTLCDRLYYL